MNKKIFLIFTFIFSFFIMTDVYASEKVGINYDDNEHFNYFYEQKNNTAFYNFLLSHRTDFPTHMKKYPGSNISAYADYYLIYYSKDLEKYLLDGQIFPDKAKYVILGLDYGYACNTISKFQDKYGFGCGEDFTFSNRDDNKFVMHTLYFFDNDGNFISAHRTDDYIDGITNFYFEIDGTSKESSAEFTYFLSNLFYVTNPVSLYGFINEIIVTDIYFENEHYIIDDNENYSSFTAWFRTFFTSAHKLDVSGTQLNYFREKKYYDGINRFLSLYEIQQYDTGFRVPKGYTNVTLSDSNNYFFFPKNIDNSLLNRDFYTYLPDFVNTENAAIGANIMDLKSGSYNYIGLDPEDTKTKRIFEMKYKKSFKLYSINFSKEINDYNPNKNYTDFAFVFVNRWAKASPVLYYNPEAYNVCIYDDSSSSCTYNDPYTGESKSLTSEELYEIASQVDSSGASVDIFDNADSQVDYAMNNSEFYKYDEDGNIVGFGVGKIVKNVGAFLSTFNSIITSLFAYFTLFFNSLPIEIQSLLYFLLIGSVIIIIYKLIRG